MKIIWVYANYEVDINEDKFLNKFQISYEREREKKEEEKEKTA